MASSIKTVGIKELKNNLSAYLREVRRGTRILVSDRQQVVAELREPGQPAYGEPDANPTLAEWSTTGVVSLPTRKKTALPRSPLALDDGTAERLLAQDRGDP